MMTENNSSEELEKARSEIISLKSELAKLQAYTNQTLSVNMSLKQIIEVQQRKLAKTIDMRQSNHEEKKEKKAYYYY